MGPRDDTGNTRDRAREPDRGHGGPVCDRRWRADARRAVRCATALLTLLLLVDGAAGTLTPWRGVFWLALAVLLFVVLYPVRVAAGEGWLTTRRLLGTRSVRTDLLVSVRWHDGVSHRLILNDALGGRVELDPAVFVDNPDLWYRVEQDALGARAGGFLRCGGEALRRLTERVDGENARTVFHLSGLD
ncbi:hypothetical protein [Streptomyces sp. NPDC127063]|uniref:hypothetical protein n=1 Tax=Streptomyces sp. NPDC127063 TaxID=3347123 RepID=UPI00365BB174